MIKKNVFLKIQSPSSETEDQRAPWYIQYWEILSSICRFLHQNRCSKKSHILTHLGLYEGRQVWLCGGIADVSPVMENNLPAQVGGAQSWQRMGCGKHFSEAGRTNSPCLSPFCHWGRLAIWEPMSGSIFYVKRKPFAIKQAFCHLLTRCLFYF